MSACEINDSANMKALDKQWETGVDMTRATIAEVAELSGVSQATVSRALRGAGKVAPKTRAKVEQLRTGWALPYLKAHRLCVRENHAGCPAVFRQTQRMVQRQRVAGRVRSVGTGSYDVSPTFVTGRQETERYFAKLPKNRNADAIIIRRSNSTNPHVRNCVSPICRRSV